MTKQDILHALLVAALVGVVLQPHLVGVVSVAVQKWVEVALVGLQAFVYYADVIFVKKQEVSVTPPQ